MTNLSSLRQVTDGMVPLQWRHSKLILGRIMKALISAIFVAAALGSALPASAAGDHGHGAMPMAAATDGMSEGMVKKVDAAKGKITIKHGPLKNLGMPGMTMVFKAASMDMLKKVKPGDTVHFVAEDVGGTLTVTQLESAQ
jgi:Cu/Ag efflux protein CusF